MARLQGVLASLGMWGVPWRTNLGRMRVRRNASPAAPKCKHGVKRAAQQNFTATRDAGVLELVLTIRRCLDFSGALRSVATNQVD